MPTVRKYLPALAAGVLLASPCTAQTAAPLITKTESAPVISSFTPGAGPLGTNIIITGSGFTGTTSVTIDGLASSFSVKSDTTISDLLPPTASGTIAVTTPAGTGKSTTAFTVTPGLQLSTATGHESQAFTITAAGFSPYSSVDVYFDTTDLALAVSNALGVVSISIQVPTTAQPGIHWITLDARANHAAAQAKFTVNTNWPMQGVSFNGLGSNPFENTLTTGNVAGLDTAWIAPSGGYGNTSPFIEVGGNIYVGDVFGAIFAYSNTGTRLWYAQPASADFQGATPASYGSLVYFASGSSVYAYQLACHSTGALCTPSWTATLPSGVAAAASLTVFEAMLYVPGSDGNIYPITPATGVIGTPFAAFGSSSAATSSVSFDLAGGFYYAEGNTLAFRTGLGSSGTENFSAALSTPVVNQGHVYFTTADGHVHEFGGWTSATSGTGCAPQPAIANNLVFAGGCGTLGAYEAGQGTLVWSIPTPGEVLGLSVANGVVYACVISNYAGQLVAYAATYGGLLWSGGACTGAPVVANGTVYGALGDIAAYALVSTNPNYLRPRPAPSLLTPNPKLRPQITPNAAWGR